MTGIAGVLRFATLLLILPWLAKAQTPPPAVLVATAELRAIAAASEFVGRVKAADRVDLRARVTGFLGPRLFQDGDHVAEGQVLFRLDPAPFEAIVQQRQAAVQSAEATLQLADMQAQRGRELIRSNSIPQSQLDEREATLTRARADLALAQAALREAGINLSYTQITSPIPGRIGEASASPGNLVGPSSGVLAAVVREDPIQVTFPVTQRQLLDVRRDTGTLDLESLIASLRLADGSRYAQQGRIDFVGVQADAKTDSIPMRALFPNPQEILADGMSVRVIIEPAKPEQALVIPQAALLQDQSGSYVFVVEPDRKAGIRRVKTVTQRDGTAVVLEGLQAGQPVIVQGQARVRPGILVAPSPMPSQGS